MSLPPLHWTSVALGASLALAACATSREEVRSSPRPVAGDSAEASVTARARADSLRYPYTVADVRFMSAMIGHHSQAIAMSRWALTNGASSSVRTLAERIINGQQDEIATMQGWLRDRGKPVPLPDRTGRTAHTSPSSGHGSDHDMPMPGMLTEAQLRQLEQARGEEFDRLFLTYMIQHHRGAVSMVEDLFGTPGAARDETVFKFANDVSVDQSTEVARMEKMLAALDPETTIP